MRKILAVIIGIIMALSLCSCGDNGGGGGGGVVPPTDTFPEWKNGEITYAAKDIAQLSGATPTGYANYDEQLDVAVVKSLSTELDNYGGIQTDMIELDFRYPVIFQMDVSECYTQYIVKLYVAGDKLPYYVLSDEGTTGLISVDLTDSMLCEKYRQKGTTPDPSKDGNYQGGWKYNNQSKKCAFYIMPKGPYDERQTASMNLKSIKITNKDEAVVSGIEILSSGIVDGNLSIDNKASVSLTAKVTPETASNKNIIWSSDDSEIVSVTANGVITANKVGKTMIYATSQANMSKRTSLEVTVLSGYEGKPQQMLDEINKFADGQANIDKFYDLYYTKWQSDGETVSVDEVNSAKIKLQVGEVFVENYFVTGLASSTNVRFSSADKVVVCSDGAMKVYNSVSNIPLELSKDTTKLETYTQQILLTRGNTIKKLSVEVQASTMVRDYTASDIVDTWVNGDSFVLGAGEAVLDGGAVKITERNRVAAYGGIVSEPLANIDTSKQLEIVINVHSTSHDGKALWDLRVMYFNEAGIKVGNPRTLLATTKQGETRLVLSPKYSVVRLYLVANGNDVSGDALEGASIKINSLKIQYLD